MRALLMRLLVLDSDDPARFSHLHHILLHRDVRILQLFPTYPTLTAIDLSTPKRGKRLEQNSRRRHGER